MTEQKDWAETAVLASALLNDDALYESFALLTANDFQDPRNRMLFSTLINLNEQKIRPDVVTVINALKTTNSLQAAGGEEYIAGLEADLPPVAEVNSYINAVKDNALLKNFKELLQQLYKEATQKVTDIPTFVGEAERRLSETASNRRVAGFRESGEVLASLLGKLEETSLERIRTGKKAYLSGVSTGYASLDRVTNGFQRSDLIIVAARPSVGKTALAINFALEVAKKRVPVAFFSLEMSAEQIMSRLLTNMSDLSKDDIQALDFKTTHDETGKKILSVADKDRQNAKAIGQIKALKAAVDILSAMPLYIDDNPGSKVVNIEAEVKKLLTRLPDLGLVIIDYLGLIQSAGANTRNQDNRVQIVSDISRALKGLARDLKIPVIALSQLSRDSEKRSTHTPVLSDLRDSGAIEQDADQVMLIYRPDAAGKDEKSDDDSPYETAGDISTVHLIVAKNRNGRTGTVDFVFEKSKSRFSEAADLPEDGENAEPDNIPPDLTESPAGY